jgi:hypothetical protein
VGVGQIGVSESQRSLGRGVWDQLAAFGIRAGGDEIDVLLRAGNDRNVVGARDRDRERHRGYQIALLEVVVDVRRIGQGQRLASGKEVERVIGNLVGPGR